MEQETGIAELVAHAGGQSAVARALTAAGYEISQQAISLWVKAGFVPFDRLQHVQNVFGTSIPGRRLVDPKFTHLLDGEGEQCAE